MGTRFRKTLCPTAGGVSPVRHAAGSFAWHLCCPRETGCGPDFREWNSLPLVYRGFQPRVNQRDLLITQAVARIAGVIVNAVLRPNIADRVKVVFEFVSFISGSGKHA